MVYAIGNDSPVSEEDFLMVLIHMLHMLDTLIAIFKANPAVPR